MSPCLLTCLLMLAVCAAPAVRAPDESSRQAIERFEVWFRSYRARRIRLLQPGLPGGPGGSFHTTTERQRMEAVFLDLESLDGPQVARLLARAAVFGFSPRESEMNRDVAEQPWIVRRRAEDALARLTDPDARSWIRSELLEERSGAGAAESRALAARVIGRQADPAGVYHLSRALLDDEPEVRVAAATGLGRLAAPAGLPALLSVLDDPMETVRAAAVAAVEEILSAPAIDPGRLDRVLTALEPLLHDSSWSVRLATVELLGRVRSARPIPWLIEALDREQTGGGPEVRGRVRAAIQASLRAVTGAYHPETRPDEWRQWWHEAGPTFRLPAASPSRGGQSRYGTFFDIPVDSTNVIFAIDISGSMADELGRSATGRAARSKWQTAYEELARTLDQMHEETRFGLILFSDRVTRAAGKMQRATPEARQLALRSLRQHPPQGGTNLFEALARGLGLSALGLTPEMAADRADTLFVLSDGAPTVGPIVDADEILAAITRANRILRVRINTITFGPEDSHLLAELARRSGGRHIHIRR